MNKQQFRAIGRDLFFDLECNCPDNSVLYIAKYKIKLTGYADDYFFDVVNEKPRQSKCGKCGRKFSYQWFRDGIVCEFNIEREQ